MAQGPNTPPTTIDDPEEQAKPEDVHTYSATRRTWFWYAVGGLVIAIVAVIVLIAMAATGKLSTQEETRTPVDILGETYIVEKTKYLDLYMQDVSPDNYTVPTEIGLLTGLTSLSIYGSYKGAIIGREEKDDTKNITYGPIPTEIGLLTGLKQMVFHQMKFDGSIPSQFGLLTTLNLLIFSTNLVTGSIPTEIGSWKAMEYFALWSSSPMSGTIPSEIGAFKAMTKLTLTDIQLTGEIPTEFGLLTNLESMDMTRNQLTGEIPSELGLLTRMSSLLLYDNDLTGVFPDALCTTSTNLEERDVTIDCAGVTCNCEACANCFEPERLIEA